MTFVRSDNVAANDVRGVDQHSVLVGPGKKQEPIEGIHVMGAGTGARAREGSRRAASNFMRSNTIPLGTITFISFSLKTLFQDQNKLLYTSISFWFIQNAK
jgi:hypothetical protein